MQQTRDTSSAEVRGVRVERRKRVLKGLRRAWGITGASLWLLFLLFQFFANRPSGPARTAMKSDAHVIVTAHVDHLVFAPRSAASKGAGLIFFPGSLVDPAAYAPLARAVAAEGYNVAIVPLPLRSAPLKSQKAVVAKTAADIISRSRRTGPKRWAVAGHSLGGVFAARFARDHPELTDGLILIGTSHPRDFDISRLTMDVTKIFGSEDGLASPEEVRRYRVNLPKGTHWVEVKGGNHAQFGWYGSQLGDHRAKITHADQQSQLAQAVLSAMARVEARPGPSGDSQRFRVMESEPQLPR